MNAPTLGIDMAKLTFTAALLFASDRFLKEQFDHHGSGFKRLDVWLKRHGVGPLRVAVEATSTYAEALAPSSSLTTRRRPGSHRCASKGTCAASRAPAQLAEQPRCLMTRKGVGLVTVAAVVAELPPITEQTDPRAISAWAGLTPRRWQSGPREWATRLSRKGHAHLRQVLYMPALVAKRHNPLLRTFAQQLAARGKTQGGIPHKMLRILQVGCGYTVVCRSALGFELFQERDEVGVAFQALEIGVLLHPIEVAITKLDGLAQGTEGVRLAFHQRETASEVVVRGRIRGQQADKLTIHAEPIVDPAVFGVEAAKNLDDVGIRRIAFQNRLVELNLELVIVNARHGVINCAADTCP
jgi:hypothetical protein